MTLPMLAPTLLLAVLAQPPEGLLHPSLSVALGYGTHFARIVADCSFEDRVSPPPEGICNPTYAQGLGVSLGGQLLFGGFVRAGGELELGSTLGSGVGLTAAALGVVRVGWDVFADAGVGVGYAWAQREDLFFGDVAGGELGVALGIRLGTVITDHLAIVVRGSYVERYRAPLFVGVGLEWQL